MTNTNFSSGPPFRRGAINNVFYKSRNVSFCVGCQLKVVRNCFPKQLSCCWLQIKVISRPCLNLLTLAPILISRSLKLLLRYINAQGIIFKIFFYFKEEKHLSRREPYGQKFFFRCFRFVSHHSNQKKLFQLWNFWSRLEIPGAHCVMKHS